MLPLVLTMPFYVLLITMIIECTLMLTAKIGSVGAAYSAARAAAVWLPYESAMPKTAPDYTPIEDRELMVRLAAARSMWPYASGSKSHASDEPLDEFIDATMTQQIEAFRTYSGHQKFDAEYLKRTEYLKRKFAYAFNALTIAVDYFDPITRVATEKPAFNAKLQLTLHYEAPIHTFGIGRLFGEKSQTGKFFVRPVVTTVLIENEGVKPSLEGKRISPDKLSKSLGIRYYDLLAYRTVNPLHNSNQVPLTKVPSTVVLFGGIDYGHNDRDTHDAGRALAASRNAREGRIGSTIDLSPFENVVINVHSGFTNRGGVPMIAYDDVKGEARGMTAHQLALYLRENGFQGNYLELVACNSTAFAQELADELGMSVRGYPHLITVSPSDGEVARFFYFATSPEDKSPRNNVSR